MVMIRAEARWTAYTQLCNSTCVYMKYLRRDGCLWFSDPAYPQHQEPGLEEDSGCTEYVCTVYAYVAPGGSEIGMGSSYSTQQHNKEDKELYSVLGSFRVKIPQ